MKRKVSKAIAARFWTKVSYRPETGCLEWDSKYPSSRYGSFSFGGKAVSAHRFAWELAVGKIPNGLHVLHHCDNGYCIRPDHLWLGTHSDNIKDMHAKNRSNNNAEKHPLAKLTEEKVRMLRSNKNNKSDLTWAREWGLHHATVYSARHRRTWRFVK